VLKEIDPRVYEWVLREAGGWGLTGAARGGLRSAHGSVWIIDNKILQWNGRSIDHCSAVLDFDCPSLAWTTATHFRCFTWSTFMKLTRY